MPYIENDLEFSARQSCASVWDDERELFRYANGAIWSNGHRAGEDPPTDAHELDKRLCEYWAVVVDQQRAELKRCEQFLRVQAEYAAAGAGCLPPPEAIQQRRKLRATLLKSESALEEARQKLAVTPENLHRQQVAHQRQQHKDAARQLLALLNTGD